MKALFLCSNSRTEASMRFRVLQFQPEWAARGHQGTVSSFFDDAAGRWWARVARGTVRRARDMLRARSMDLIFVHREAFPLSLNTFVRALPARLPLVFDFDDAVHLPVGGWRGRLARPESTRELIERADLVFAGNAELEEYARAFSARVRIVPTVVDTNRFRPRLQTGHRPLVVGWVGSPSTAKYLHTVLSTLERVATEVPFTLRLIGAGRRFSSTKMKIENLPWRLEGEVEAFQDLDIGIYPLVDDAWSRGKSGFKAIQYMACGVPFVASPVGAVRNVTHNGVEGLWAGNADEWHEGLRGLVLDAELRARLGTAGRAAAVERFSVSALAPRWVRALETPAEAATGAGEL